MYFVRYYFIYFSFENLFFFNLFTFFVDWFIICRFICYLFRIFNIYLLFISFSKYNLIVYCLNIAVSHISYIYLFDNFFILLFLEVYLLFATDSLIIFHRFICVLHIDLLFLTDLLFFTDLFITFYKFIYNFLKIHNLL